MAHLENLTKNSDITIPIAAIQITGAEKGNI